MTSQLLINIFEHNTPLHDGAIIVRGDRIVAATCYLPLSDNMELSKELGTRHRAAVGISEITDSITIIVSEETGNISVAMNGQLTQYKPEGLSRLLRNLLVPDTEKPTGSPLFRPIIDTAKSLGFNRSRRQSETRKQQNVDERIQPLEIVDLTRQGVNTHGKAK